MSKRSVYFFLFILGWVLPVLACGGSGNTTAEVPPTIAAAATIIEAENIPPSPMPATPEPPSAVAEITLEPTATVDAAASPDAPSAPTAISLNANNQYGEPVGVNSYQMTLRFDSTLTGADGSVTNGSILITGQRDVSQNASTFTATGSGTADFGGGQQFSFTQLGDTTHFILPNGSCTSFSGSGPASTNNPFAIFLDNGGVLGNLEGAVPGVPPTEVVNGIATHHYTFNETHLNPIDPTTPDITSVTGDIYLAQAGGYVVRLVMQGIGASNLLNGIDGDGEIYYELNYFDFDQPVTITVPAGCTADAAANYPILPEATDQNAIGSYVTYRSETNFADAVAFYKTEMAAAGWALVQETGAEPVLSLIFAQNGEQVEIAILSDGQGVVISINDQLLPG